MDMRVSRTDRSVHPVAILLKDGRILEGKYSSLDYLLERAGIRKFAGMIVAYAFTEESVASLRRACETMRHHA